MRELELAEPLWLGKEKLNQHGRCEGLFQAVLAGEAPPFAHSARSAHGVLLHKAIEVEVGARDGMDPHEIAQVAVGRVLEREERFGEYWRELVGRRAGRRPHGGRAAGDAVPGVVPAVEAACGASSRRSASCGCAPSCSAATWCSPGRSTSCSGVPDRLEPNRATRLVVDLKTGSALSRVRRGHALLRPRHDAAVRGAAVPSGLAVPRERHVAGRGRHRGDPAACRRPSDRGRAGRRGARRTGASPSSPPASTARGAPARPCARSPSCPRRCEPPVGRSVAPRAARR